MNDERHCPTCRCGRPLGGPVSYARDAVVRPDQHHPSKWRPLPNGMWKSPGGRLYRDARIIAKVTDARRQLGLSTTYAEYAGEPA